MVVLASAEVLARAQKRLKTPLAQRGRSEAA